ncbi:phosphonoacetaldehyde hydrolase [Companilactobacillus ginsenosidimutans]|uniref:Phosphonoacetaldehyde hydrolase n=1 Tax=Companilactobacillus ginsenosidimutans TaxID=1007676 RepID=A0A0H4QK21_9LACO|nr:phosphonoacetaldehyde hydrolase [Companilactobacillus ginsenosidimutans]AKP67003.1 phosphonoacetaldehyde hydrolase [Companilactobacillus ginsenosidimutans]
MIEAVIFDWAGTTVDYGSLAPVVAFKAAFNTKSIYPTDEEIRQFMGMSKWDHIGEMLQLPTIRQQWEDEYGELPTEDDRKELYTMFESALMAHLVKQTELKPHLLDTIDFLEDSGIQYATTTGYTPEMMDAVQRGASNLGYKPDIVLTSADVNNNGRPAPDMIEKILFELGEIKPEEALKVGDTIVDIEEGRNAGVQTVGIIDGSSLMGLNESDFNNLTEDEREAVRAEVRQQFETVDADYIINDLSELPEVIKSLNQLKEM